MTKLLESSNKENGRHSLIFFCPGCQRCHSFVRDGKIRFLADSYHELAGQTVDLPEVD